MPVKHDAAGKLCFDALLLDEVDLAILFSANRAYFLVDMEVPSAYVDFLRAILPDKTAAELYTMVGLQKAGKNLFYRDFLHHLTHSRDKFIIAPGITGLVMTVFTLPSYPYVFKVIRDKIAASKDTDRQKVKQKYALVKHHDRVGRMTDILEYSDVAFPRERFSRRARWPSCWPSRRRWSRSRRDHIVVRHLYIERRMIAAQPLSRACRRRAARARDARVRRCDQGAGRRQHLRRRSPVQELRRHPLRPRRVLRLRRDRVPDRSAISATFQPPPPGWDEMSGDVWYPRRPLDVFPEEFATFLLTDPRTARVLHAPSTRDLLDARWWQANQAALRAGKPAEVLSYGDAVRFPAPAAV